MQRAWIVGAGFSKSLGAPLLNELLAPAARMAIESQFSDVLPAAEADPVFWLYHYGTDFPEGKLKPIALAQGVRRWRDAEQFLETLDEACENPLVAQELVDLWSQFRSKCGFPTEKLPEPTAFRRNAKRVVAASCSGFVEGRTRDSVRKRERWLPYLDWLKRLRDNDTIISFNYDRVIELLAPEVPGVEGVSYHWGPFVAGIKRSLAEIDRADEAKAAGLPTLLKLHGSVDWVVNGDKVERLEWNRELLAAPNEPAIAIPGPQKMDMANGFFKMLWGRARTALKEADEIYLLGFRFPESDAHPRQELLGALSQNQRPSLTVHTVLGPDVTGKDSRRVLDLLEWTSSPRRVVFQPGGGRASKAGETTIFAEAMYVEDFLTVWANKTDVPPPRSAGAG